MTWLQALFLALLQGLTEFLPVSSSGHLAVAQLLLPGFTEPGIAYAVVLHVGTLISVLIYFREELKSLLGLPTQKPTVFTGRERSILIAVLAASVPTGIIGLAIEKFAVAAFDSILIVGIGWLVTAALLWTVDGLEAPKSKEKKTEEKSGISIKQALIIGVAQGLAVIPGISRSGSTVATGLILKLDREAVFAFSFIVSIPAILGATMLEAVDIASAISPGGRELSMFLVGGAVACVTGYFALDMFGRFVKNVRFTGFAYYCLLLGVAALIVGLFA